MKQKTITNALPGLYRFDFTGTKKRTSASTSTASHTSSNRNGRNGPTGNCTRSKCGAASTTTATA